jgi:hypothetical protein
MITRFDGNTKVPDYNLIYDELVVSSIENNKVLINKNTGGWIYCDDLDLIEVFNPGGITIKIAEILYDANIIKKNGDYFFDPINLIKNNQISCFSIQLDNLTEPKVNLIHKLDSILEFCLSNNSVENILIISNNGLLQYSASQINDLIDYANLISRENNISFSFVYKSIFSDHKAEDVLNILKENKIHATALIKVGSNFINSADLKYLKENIEKLREINCEIDGEIEYQLDFSKEEFENIVKLLKETNLDYIRFNTINNNCIIDEKQIANIEYDFFINHTLPIFTETNKVFITMNMCMVLNNILQTNKMFISDSDLYYTRIKYYCFDNKGSIINKLSSISGSNISEDDECFSDCKMCEAKYWCAHLSNSKHFGKEYSTAITSNCKILNALCQKTINGLCNNEINKDLANYLNRRLTEKILNKK